jgi:hypothetical protein
MCDARQDQMIRDRSSISLLPTLYSPLPVKPCGFHKICGLWEPGSVPNVPGKAPVSVVKDLIHACIMPISINVQLQTILPFPAPVRHVLRMRSLLCQFTLVVAILGSLPGCLLMPSDDVPVAVEDVLPSMQGRGVTLDETQIPSYDAVRATVTPLLSDVRDPLTASECACLAAAQSQTAAVLEREAAYLCREVSGHRRRAVSRLLPDIVADQARRERNDAAEQALIAYYRLAEIELQQGVLSESYQERQRTQETVDGLRGAGMAADYDQSDLQRQRLQLDQQSLQLTHDQARLTGVVKSLIGKDAFSPEAIETTCAIEPRAPEFGLPEALEIGRAQDVELRALRRFLQEGDVEDLDVARSLLKTASPFLGQVPASLGLLAKLMLVCGHDARGEQELAVRKRQLQALCAARQQQVDLEVAGEVINVQQRFLDASVAKDVLDSWDRRIATLESNREVQKSDYAGLVAARVERLKAKSDLLHKLVELEIAHVKVKAALGILGEECAAGRSSAGPRQQ